MTISPKAFQEALAAGGVDFYTGVPDSLLKEFCAYIDASLPDGNHVIAVNEGAAVAIAAGYHLATGKIPLVYMQNSGLGNAVNPLLSLADADVYGLPMVILIGWRGAPGVKDEPQHIKQGRVTPNMINAMGYPFRIISGDSVEGLEAARWAAATAEAASAPVVLLVHKDTFARSEAARSGGVTPEAWLSREEAIAVITAGLPASAVVVASTGMISRELYEQRKARCQGHSSDFLTVGSMGHASQIALGIAHARPEADVICLDGDGAMLMHMGGLATVGAASSGKILHIVLNNGAHDSVGGQPTAAFHISVTGVARACGYDTVEGPVDTSESIQEAVSHLAGLPGKRFLEVRVRLGARSDLGRPKESPRENRQLFTTRLRG